MCIVKFSFNIRKDVLIKVKPGTRVIGVNISISPCELQGHGYRAVEMPAKFQGDWKLLITDILKWGTFWSNGLVKVSRHL